VAGFIGKTPCWRNIDIVIDSMGSTLPTNMQCNCCHYFLFDNKISTYFVDYLL
jgi:hypothetical protein